MSKLSAINDLLNNLIAPPSPAEERFRVSGKVAFLTLTVIERFEGVSVMTEVWESVAAAERRIADLCRAGLDPATRKGLDDAGVVRAFLASPAGTGRAFRILEKTIYAHKDEAAPVEG